MARSIHKLSDVSLKARSKAGRLSDGGGLYLRISPSTSKTWAFMWTVRGVRQEMGLGSYPAISLAAARKLATAYREDVAEGRDPKRERDKTSEPIFADAVQMYLSAMEEQWSNEKHRYQWGQTLGPSYCGPILNLRVSQIGLNEILKILQPIWSKKPETASRLRGRLERVLNFCKVKGWREGENPALWRGNLENVLPKKPKLTRGHQAAMPYNELSSFIAKLRTHEAMAALALEFLILTAGRTGEVLGAQWDEIDMDEAVWTVPAERMKLRKEHRVPLSNTAMNILRSLYEIRTSDYVFPGKRLAKPLSDMSMMMLLRRMKHTNITVHGFRSSFRDWAGDETNFSREVTEQSLAHKIGDATEQAYRRSDALEKRRRLMEAWAEYCGGEKPGKVVNLHG